MTSGIALALATAGALALSTASTLTGAHASTAPGPGTAVVSAAGAPSTAVDPLTLHRGAAPHVPWFDARTGRIHDGARTVPARFPGQVLRLARVSGGYLLESVTPTGWTTLRTVTTSGGSRVLAHVRRVGVLGMVSSDRRTFVSYTGDSRTHAVVRRVGDGAVVATRTFGAAQTWAVALEPHRALMTVGDRTVWWVFGRSSLRRVADDPAYEAAPGTGRLVLGRGSSASYYLSSVPPRRLPSWSWPAGRPAGEFSPDGRRVLTLTPQAGSRYGGTFSAVAVRGAGHGRVVRTLTGRFGVEGYHQDPRWESPTSVLVLARQPVPDDHGIEKMAWVRCTPAGRCETAGPVLTVDLDKPPYGPSPWVLADGPGTVGASR